MNIFATSLECEFTALRAIGCAVMGDEHDFVCK